MTSAGLLGGAETQSARDALELPRLLGRQGRSLSSRARPRFFLPTYYSLTYPIASTPHSLTHSLTQLNSTQLNSTQLNSTQLNSLTLARWLAHSLTHSLLTTYLLTYLHTDFVAYSLTYWLTYLLNYFLTQLRYLLTYSLTYFLTRSDASFLAGLHAYGLGLGLVSFFLGWGRGEDYTLEYVTYGRTTYLLTYSLARIKRVLT